MSKTKLALDVVNDLRSLANSIESLVGAESNPEAATEPSPPTLEEVRAAMAEKNRAGHREAVKAIIYKYGADKLTALEPQHYTAVLQEVGAIK